MVGGGVSEDPSERMAHEKARTLRLLRTNVKPEGKSGTTLSCVVRAHKGCMATSGKEAQAVLCGRGSMMVHRTRTWR